MTVIDMRTYFRRPRPARLGGLPSRTPASPCTLREAIQAAVETIEDESFDLLWPDNPLTLGQARAVLASLTLCYARQIYGSKDAGVVVARDLSFPCLYGGEFPDASVLRQFRSVNTDAIRRCLTAALHFLVEQKVASGVVTRVNLSQLAEEAHRRIIMAMFVDSMEMDRE